MEYVLVTKTLGVAKNLIFLRKKVLSLELESTDSA